MSKIDTTKSADELKELGNKFFASKDFETAVEYYTAAISKNPKNHVYFSNRSASYAGLEDYAKAVDDAKKCIQLNPSFVKGYYRLATAQMAKDEYEAATQTIKQGMNIDPHNPPLSNLMQKLKQHKKRMVAAARPQPKTMPQPTAGVKLDAATSAELHELRQQFYKTSKDLELLKVDLARAQREKKSHEITLDEVTNFKADESVYRPVGKIFVKSTKGDMADYLKGSMKAQSKKEVELTGKMEYIERKLKSQQQNIEELMGSAVAVK